MERAVRVVAEPAARQHRTYIEARIEHVHFIFRSGNRAKEHVDDADMLPFLLEPVNRFCVTEHVR